MDAQSLEATDKLEDYFMEFCFSLIKGKELKYQIVEE